MQKQNDILNKATNALKNEPARTGPPQDLIDTVTANLTSAQPPKTIISKRRITIRRLRKIAAAAAIVVVVAIGLMHWLPGGKPEVKIPRELLEMPVEKLLEIHFGKPESTFDSSVVAAAVAKALDRLPPREILAIGQKYGKGGRPGVMACIGSVKLDALSEMVEACDFFVHAHVDKVDLDVSDLKAAIIHKQRNRLSLYSGAPVKTAVQLNVISAYPPLPSSVGEKIRFTPVFNSENINLLEEGKEYLIALGHEDGLFWLMKWRRGIYPVDPNGAVAPCLLRSAPKRLDDVWVFIMDAYDAIHEGALPSGEILDYWLAGLQSNDMTDCLTAIEYFNTLAEPVAPQELIVDAMERFLSGRIVDSGSGHIVAANRRRDWFALQTLALVAQVPNEPTIDRMFALYEKYPSKEILRLALKHLGPKRRERFLSFLLPGVENLQVTGNQIYFEVIHQTGKRMGITLTLEDGILHGEQELPDSSGERFDITLERISSRPGSVGEGPARPVVMPDDAPGLAAFEGTWSGLAVRKPDPSSDQLTLVLEIDENGQLVGSAFGSFVFERPLETLIAELAKAEGEDIDQLFVEMLEDPAGFGILTFNDLSLVWEAAAKRGLPEFGAYLEEFLADPTMQMPRPSPAEAEAAIRIYTQKTMPRKEAIQHLIDRGKQGQIGLQEFMDSMKDLLEPEDSEFIPFLREALSTESDAATVIAEVLPDPCFVPVLREALEKDVTGGLLAALFACGEEEEAVELGLAGLERPVNDVDPRAFRQEYDKHGSMIEFLGTTGDESCVPVLENFTHQEVIEVYRQCSERFNFHSEHGPGLRLSAIRALGRLGSKSAIPRLKELYQSDDFQIRMYAALSLYSLGDDTGYELLEYFVKGTEFSLAQFEDFGGGWPWLYSFERGVLYLQSARTDELLLESYRSSHFHPRPDWPAQVGQGEYAFARQYERELLPILVEQLNNRNRVTRKYVNALLKQLTGQDFGFEPDKFVFQQTEAIDRWYAYVDDYLAQDPQPAE